MNNSKTPGKRTLLFQMGVALVPLVLFMLRALDRRADSLPQELISTMISAIDDFVGDAPQFDDITMLVIHRN